MSDSSIHYIDIYHNRLQTKTSKGSNIIAKAKLLIADTGENAINKTRNQKLYRWHNKK